MQCMGSQRAGHDRGTSTSLHPVGGMVCAVSAALPSLSKPFASLLLSPLNVCPFCPRILLCVAAAIDLSSLTQACSSEFARSPSVPSVGGALQACHWLQVSRMVADSLFVHLNFIPQSDCFRENMPSHFKFKEYCPMVFRNLRERFGIDDQDFQVSCFHNIYLKWVSLMPFAP